MKTDNHVLYGSFEDDYVTITNGDGVYVYDDQGKQYLDAVGGVCVVNIGHGVEEIGEVIKQQLDKVTYLLPISNFS